MRPVIYNKDLEWIFSAEERCLLYWLGCVILTIIRWCSQFIQFWSLYISLIWCQLSIVGRSPTLSAWTCKIKLRIEHAELAAFDVSTFNGLSKPKPTMYNILLSRKLFPIYKNWNFSYRQNQLQRPIEKSFLQFPGSLKVEQECWGSPENIGIDYCSSGLSSPNPSLQCHENVVETWTTMDRYNGMKRSSSDSGATNASREPETMFSNVAPGPESVQPKPWKQRFSFRQPRKQQPIEEVCWSDSEHEHGCIF